MNTSGYVPALDGLRAIAAIAVVALHTWPGLTPHGHFGVDVFFVLSGYLTTAMAISGRTTVLEFLHRRIRRLWPLMAAVTLAYTPLIMLYDKPWPSETLWNLFFLSNWVVPFAPAGGVLSHFWTLGVEMQFYLLIALLGAKFSRAQVLRISIALFVIGTLSRALLVFYGFPKLGYFTIAHSSGLFLGAILATLPKPTSKKPTSKMHPLVPILALAGLFYLFQSRGYGQLEFQALRIPIAEILSACLVLACVSGSPLITQLLAFEPLRRLGLVSFGIYVWHYPIALIAIRATSGPMAFLITLSLSTALATLSYHIVERPMRVRTKPVEAPHKVPQG